MFLRSHIIKFVMFFTSTRTHMVLSTPVPSPTVSLQGFNSDTQSQIKHEIKEEMQEVSGTPSFSSHQTPNHRNASLLNPPQLSTKLHHFNSDW